MGAVKPEDNSRDKLYRLVFEHSRDSMLVLELGEGRPSVVIDANPAALQLHGFSREELVGGPVSVLGASLSRGRVAPFGGTTVFEVSQKKKDGSSLVTEVTARNVRAGGKLYGILIERDITRRRGLEEEARRLSGSIMLARESEKKKLAAGLHDSLGALQVGLAAEFLVLENHLKAGEAAKASSALKRARQLLKKTSAGIKRTCVESWPPALPVSGLGGALEELLSAFSGRSGIKVRREISLTDSPVFSKSASAIIVYRLAQEMLLNAERHSGAKKLVFSLALEGDWLSLAVSDDGRGFDPAEAAAASGCLGLKIMAETAEGAGGSFAAYSSRGKGTVLKARVPLAVQVRGGL